MSEAATDSDDTEKPRRWREYAYLDAENWPEAIPAEGPRTKYGVYPWGRQTHDQYGIDTYTWSQPDAASIGYDYLGDVCPMCGKPLKTDERVVTKSGSRGELLDISESSDPEPSYHPHCYDERREELQRRQMEVVER